MLGRWISFGVFGAALVGFSGESLSAATPTDGTPKAMQGETETLSFGESDVAWPYYNRTIDGNRYSALDQIHDRNIDDLEEVCRVQVGGPGPFSAGPIMVDGVIYLTMRVATMAIDSTNCYVIWKSVYVPEEKEVFNTSRGAAYDDGVIVRGTADARLLAYDAQSGKELWRRKIGDPTIGEFVSSAPVIWQGKVFVGLAGSDWGIRGRIMAFDLKTGQTLWSFDTIPGPGEFGNDTWAGESWKTGGGGTWTSYTLDPQTGELFVPVANPAPDWNGSSRRGDNLFTNSVLVLDANTGKRRWHYQTIQHDTHDYGVTAPPILIKLDGKDYVSVAPKDGFLYLIDRATQALVYKVPTTTILNHQVEPTPEGLRFCPGIYGGVEWSSPGYDPTHSSLVVGSTDWCTTVWQTHPVQDYIAGKLYMSGRHEQDKESAGWITSFDALTGRERWKYKTSAPVVSGVTPTAGNVTFVGDMAGVLYAFQSDTGALLRKIDTRGAIAGGIITYQMAGRQYLALTSGNISRSSWPQATGIPSLVIYALPNDKIVRVEAGGDAAKRGQRLYDETCLGCHGANFEGGGSGPKLTGLWKKYTKDSLVTFIKKPPEAMPTLYPDMLSEQDIKDVVKYLETVE